MPILNRLIKDATVAQLTAQWINTMMIMLHVGLATAIIAGGSDRFSRPSYSPLIDYSHGETWIWGVIILVSGFLMSAPFKIPNILGLWIGMVWHIIWMACFTIAMIRYDNAAATATPAYGIFALICLGLLTAKVLDKPGG